MTSRRDLLLAEMKISQWTLAKPQVLKGDAQIRVGEQVKLVVVCEQDFRQSGLFRDVLLTLGLNEQAYLWLTLEQSLRLVCEHTPIFWLIDQAQQAVKFGQKFANAPLWQVESWQDLQQNPHKRQFWQQIQPFCHHFDQEND